MQFTKRMWIAMLAAVLLVAGGLSYFAVAADVEPYGVVDPTSCPECRTGTMREVYSGTSSRNDAGNHIYTEFGYQQLCSMERVTREYYLQCSYCTYRSDTIQAEYIVHIHCGKAPELQ